MAVNTRVLARMTCPQCNRPDVAVRQNYTIYEHQGFDDSGMPCFGSHPEVVLTVLLRIHDLDARHDADSDRVRVRRDDWHTRKAAFDKANRHMYDQPIPMLPLPKATR